MGDAGDTRDLGPRPHAVELDDTGEAPQSEPPPAPAAPLDAAVWPVADAARYQVAGEHARGGIGRILDAVDRRLERPVAVKELLSVDRRAEARFVREALVTARLQHPSIVPVHEVGRWPTGEPFYTMKMVQGRSLAELIRSAKTLEERLALLPNVIAVADAVAYAHSQKVIHRDLKPSNVLVGPFGETVVIDWGLAADLSQAARAVDAELGPYRLATTSLTVAGAVMGTPEYMPPEQARGEPCDERADVYAIGAILYHVLAGKPPYRGETADETLAQLEASPPPPLPAAVPADLVTIVHKAMARDASGRYRTAAELTEDLKRFQTGQLVAAHQYSTATLLLRWLKRHRAPVAVATLALALLGAFGFYSFRRIIRQRNDLILAQARAWLDKDPTTAIAWLKTYPRNGGRWDEAQAIAVEAEGLGVARHIFPGKSIVYAVHLAHSEAKIVIAAEKRIEIRDLPTGALLNSLPIRDGIFDVEFSPDDKTILILERKSLNIEIWNPATERVQVFRGHAAPVYDVEFAPDSSTLASASADGTVRIWSIASGEPHVVPELEHPAPSLRFSSDGGFLASAGNDHTIRVLNLRTGGSRMLKGASGEVRRLRFSHDGNFIAGVVDREIIVWDITSGSARRLQGHSQPIYHIAFAERDNQLVSASMDLTVRLWNITTGAGRILRGHSDEVFHAAFSPDGRLVATTGLDRTVRLWSTETGQTEQILRGPKNRLFSVHFSSDGRFLVARTQYAVEVWAVLLHDTLYAGELNTLATFSADGRWVAAGGKRGEILLKDIPKDERSVLGGYSSGVSSMTFSSDGSRLAAGGSAGEVGIWNPVTGQSRILEAIENAIVEVQFSPNDEYLLCVSESGALQLYDLESGGRRLLPFRLDNNSMSTVAFSPDSETVMVGRGTRRWSWKIRTGEERNWEPKDIKESISADGDISTPVAGRWRDLRPFKQFILPQGRSRRVSHWAAFYPQSGLAAGIGGGRGESRLTQVQLSTKYGTRRKSGENRMLRGHGGPISDLDFSGDGRLIATSSEDQSARVWDVATGHPIVVRWHAGKVNSVSFSPDGKWLATASDDKTVRIWPIDAQEWQKPADTINAMTTVVLGENYEATTP